SGSGLSGCLGTGTRRGGDDTAAAHTRPALSAELGRTLGGWGAQYRCRRFGQRLGRRVPRTQTFRPAVLQFHHASSERGWITFLSCLVAAKKTEVVIVLAAITRRRSCTSNAFVHLP